MGQVTLYHWGHSNYSNISVWIMSAGHKYSHVDLLVVFFPSCTQQ